jgi:hypothetical protein
MFTRRDFLKLSSLYLGGLFLPQFPAWLAPPNRQFPLQARVAITGIYAYHEPDFRSERLAYLRRDKILPMLEKLESPYGPAWNPHWYRLEQGYVHSAYLQRVEDWHFNPPLPRAPASGQLGEVTVPYTQSFRPLRGGTWVKLWRFYYGSVHWITGLREGPDGRPWYEITDDLLHVVTCARASHVRPIPPEEISPLETGAPPEDRRIEVSLSEQTLRAYEAEQVVRVALLSSGVKSDPPPDNGIPTTTPEGHFRIQVKAPSRHMGDGKLTRDPEAYELPGVPWVSFFHKDGIAFHGTYWHANFGRKMSHGCINLRIPDALWLYRWSGPPAQPWEWNVKGLGTRVHIFE